LVPSSVAAVLDLKLGGAEISSETVARAIGDKQLLLVLDNCEHLVDSTARLVELIVRRCPRSTILATSREALRVAGEYVYGVSPLEVPPPDQRDDLLEHSAVQLFIARARASQSDFSAQTENLYQIAAICRRLDGIPLAIEFAASRAGILGVSRVAASLESRFCLTTFGRRTAVPRHRTLRAVLDWSYELLPDAERRLLRYLAVFPAGFTLEAASAVMSDTLGEAATVEDGVANLAAKSILKLERSGGAQRWRLLETTRLYALERLAESGETELATRRHAEFFRDWLASSPLGSSSPFNVKEILVYARETDNIRAALNWAFGGTGDVELGVALAAAAMDFWLATSLLTECCNWGRRALADIGVAANTQQELVLQSGLGLALLYTSGMNAASRGHLMKALTLSRSLGDLEYQQRAAYGMFLFEGRSGDFRESLFYAHMYEELAKQANDLGARLVADWLIGSVQTFLGRYVEASKRLQRAVDQYPSTMRYPGTLRFGIDLRATGLSRLAGCQWSRGLVETAGRLAQTAVEEARDINHPVSLCFVLAWPCSMLFPRLGELDVAQRYISELILKADQHGLVPLRAMGVCAKGSLAAARGDRTTGIELLRSGLAGMQEAAYHHFYPVFLAELAEALGDNGRIDDGIAEIETALQRTRELEYRWFTPEMLRIKGKLVAARAGGDPSVVEDLFFQSLHQAQQQQALYWELRTATSLAEFWKDRGKASDARQILAPLYARFTEGFATPDLCRARILLAQLN
jgi:non-specific serine/threonine protein kinase